MANLVGSRGWVFNGPLLYAAKIEDVDEQRGYFIHYEGWKKKWDDWISPTEFLPDTEENRARAERLKTDHKAGVVKTSSPDAAAAAGAMGKGKRIKLEEEEETRPITSIEEFLSQQQEVEEVYSEPGAGMKINLPDELKACLVRDWENYMQRDLEIQLPCPVSVRRILVQYAESKKSSAAHLQFAQAMEIYFNRALPLVLLYKEEKHGSGKYSEEFGAEHLLRLCVRLPGLISPVLHSSHSHGQGQQGEDQDYAKQICVKVNDLLRFIAKRRKEFFNNKYVVPQRAQEEEEGEAMTTAAAV